MDKTTKTILIIVGVVLVLGVICCVGGYLFLSVGGNVLMNEMVVEDSSEALAIANQYIDFDIPAGYNAAGVNMGFMRMIMMGDNLNEDTPSSKPFITIMGMIEMEDDSNPETMRVTMEGQVMQSMGRNDVVMRKTDSFTRVIRSQNVEIMVFEGQDENGTLMKAYVSDLFDGKEGMVMLYIMGEESGWDQTLVDAFIQSIR